MRRALSILAIAAMTIGLLSTSIENEIQDQEAISCDDCHINKDDREAQNKTAISCDDCHINRDDREA